MSSPFSSIDARLRRLPDVVIFAIGIVLIAGIAAYKLTAGRGVPVVDFFLIPLAGIAWLASSPRYGYLAAVITAATSVYIALVAQPPAPTGAALTAGAMRLVFYLVVLGFLAAMRRMQVDRDAEARTDNLTGAANARAFREIAAHEIERSRRYGHELSLLYLDLDDFKAINDHLGHAEGDDVLLHVSHVLRSVVRTVDTVARIGGDEFAVLMPETDITAAHVLTMRLKGELARTGAQDGRPVPCSFGLVTFVHAPASLRELLDAGDDLMYRAKRNGKDRIEEAEVDTVGPQTPVLSCLES
jgi:diguanylate cyclase (GGDEF)-like protein